jgi:hypothetical protein
MQETCRWQLLVVTGICWTLSIAVSSADWIYALGNSLTQDTLPRQLDGNVQNGIYCNQNLQQIFDDPNGFCGSTSIAWDQAFAARQFDWVIVQPFNGTFLAQDTALLTHWMNLQPNAQFVIHTGWAWHSLHESEYHGVFGDDAFHHNNAYFSALVDNVEATTGRAVLSTRAIDVLDLIYHDIEQVNAPYTQFSELFRDWTHASYEDGRFLFHNLLRRTLGQPYSSANWPNLPTARQQYLLGAIDRTFAMVPEPGSLGMILVLCPYALFPRRRTRS